MTSTAVSGLDFNKVYTSGTIMLLNPVESNAIFIVAAMLSSAIEYLFEISADVDSTYYQDLFEVITEETLVFGVVQLTMVFLSSLTSLSEAWAIMFQWGQLLMIWMAFWLTVFIVLVANSNAKWRDYWRVFEVQRMSSSANNPSGDEKLYMRCCDKFRVTLMAYGWDNPPVESGHHVYFCDYLGIIEKRQVVKLMDLSWKAWLSMVFTATFNSFRAALINRDRHEFLDYDLWWPMISYMFFQGMGPLFFFWWLKSSLHRRLEQYLNLGSEGMEQRLEMLDYNANEPDPSRHHEVEPFQSSDLQDPKSFLFWQSLDITLTLVQISVLQVVWFYSNAVLTTGGNGWLLARWPSWIIVSLMLIPGIYLWRNLSWTITLISILSSVETAVDRELVDELFGITKEMRQAEEEAKEAEEKAKQEQEEEKKREEEGQPLQEVDDMGMMKVQVAAKRPVMLDDDLGMSRIALDKKDVARKYQELDGL